MKFMHACLVVHDENPTILYIKYAVETIYLCNSYALALVQAIWMFSCQLAMSLSIIVSEEFVGYGL